jgi:hypothetical protein
VRVFFKTVGGAGGQESLWLFGLGLGIELVVSWKRAMRSLSISSQRPGTSLACACERASEEVGLGRRHAKRNGGSP